jgi:hypothetical protein
VEAEVSGFKESVMKTWYPKKVNQSSKIRKPCPLCEGTLKVLDKRTGKERKCALCNQKGYYV